MLNFTNGSAAADNDGKSAGLNNITAETAESSLNFSLLRFKMKQYHNFRVGWGKRLGEGQRASDIHPLYGGLVPHYDI